MARPFSLIHNFRPAPAEMSSRLLQRVDFKARFNIQYYARIRDTYFPQKIPVVPYTCALSLIGAD